MSDFKDRAKDIAEGAEDIARDKLDSFRKLGSQQQILILAFAGIIPVLVVIWLLLPGVLDIRVDPLLMDGAMDNQVVITNLGDKPLGKLKIILNDRYEYELTEMTDKTMGISVTNFRPLGNPAGKPPPPDTIPKKVKVIAKDARYLIEFE